MCGRYAEFKAAQDLADAFARQGFVQDVLFADGTHEWPGNWNTAPTHDVRMIVDRPFQASASESLLAADGSLSPIVASLARTLEEGTTPEEFIADDLIRQVRRARWGLVPSWAKDPSIGSKMINARSETILEKPSFKRAFASRRCIIPANGYYEWTTHDGPPKTKTPNYITPADGSVFAFAGIYEFWKSKDNAEDDSNTASANNGDWLVTASIITTAAQGDLADIHERRPIFLTPDVFNEWLSPHTSVEDAYALIDIPVIDVNHFVVSTDVNRVSNRGPQLIIPV